MKSSMSMTNVGEQDKWGDEAAPLRTVKTGDSCEELQKDVMNSGEIL